MQNKFVKVESAAEAGIVIAALQSLTGNKSTMCAYFDRDPMEWGRKLFEKGYVYIGISDGIICGNQRVSGDGFYPNKDLDKFLLEFIDGFANIVIVGGVKRSKVIKISSGNVLVGTSHIELPCTNLSINDVEDILFSLNAQD